MLRDITLITEQYYNIMNLLQLENNFCIRQDKNSYIKKASLEYTRIIEILKHEISS